MDDIVQLMFLKQLFCCSVYSCHKSLVLYHSSITPFDYKCINLLYLWLINKIRILIWIERKCLENYYFFLSQFYQHNVFFPPWLVFSKWKSICIRKTLWNPFKQTHSNLEKCSSLLIFSYFVVQSGIYMNFNPSETPLPCNSTEFGHKGLQEYKSRLGW